MLVYHAVGHIMSMEDCGDCVEATMTAEDIQIEETDIEVVKDNDQPSKSNTSKKLSQTRRAFDHEFKLRVIKDFYQDGKLFLGQQENLQLIANKCICEFRKRTK